jgi:neutral ceramidase
VIDARRALLAAAICLALAGALPAAASAAELQAGAATVDITPENGGTALGFVRPDIPMRGVRQRLSGRALVLDDGRREVAILATDLAFPLDKESLVARLADEGFTHETILYTGTHSHSGPEALAPWQLERLAEAVLLARARKRPAAAAWASASVDDVNRNRSIEAHLANHGIEQSYGSGHTTDDPLGAEHTRDTTLRVLRVSGTDGEPIGAMLHFPVHLTTVTAANAVWDTDLAGTATHHFAERVGGEGFVALFSNGASGDVMPRFDTYNAPALVDLHGRRLAAGAVRAWRAAGRALRRDVAVDARWTRSCYCGQEVEPGRRVSDAPVWGLAFFGGSEDGASIFHEPLATEGRRLPEHAAHPVHGRKIPVAPGLVHESVPEVHVVRVGDRLLMGAPGEPSVEMGRRMQAAVAPHLPDGVEDAFVVGLSNDYMGYLITPEEYEMQHYEGGHTVFGIYTGLLVRNEFEALVRALAAGEPSPAPDEPGGLGGTGAGPPSVGQGGVEGRLLAGPSGEVERMTTVSVRWEGGPAGRERPLDEPFVRLERQTQSGWEAVDSDLGIGVVWEERDASYGALYDVPPDLPTGTHRLRVTSAAYDLATDPFEVVPSRGLRVLGVRSRRGGRVLVVAAQNPPPDPARAILWRPRTPSAGRVVVRVGGRRLAARWSRRLGGFAVRTRRAVRRGVPVVVPAGGIVDRWGNATGAAFEGRVGELSPLEWPPNMGTGGGRTPGPFGEGQFPP